ncbi:TetR family transcriptional regulator [Streptomyces sp. Ru71]|uniref:ScbR family autoregulator-binding transcription factor n=1 Tax=Streptomyces sp. Ru71 TaxID=2080746 RepID=UPI000CDD9638|nr:ScbR family autoregulator-binding transcription factor [Streptomyces sp. Ru71]POX56993.1 TetR family transcriptional regulator [Streptomyces sp. Ru71]
MKQERAARTRQALIEAAACTFERYGYEQSRLTDISARAGVSVGALNFHFKSKAAVAHAVEHEAATTLRRVARVMTRHQGQALQRLTDMSHALADRLMRDVVARAGFRLSCAAEQRTGLDLLQEWQGCVQQLVAEAADEGTLVESVEQQELAAVIVAATTGLEALGRRNTEWLSEPTLAAFWRLMMPRIATEDALGRLTPAGSARARPEAAPPPEDGADRGSGDARPLVPGPRPAGPSAEPAGSRGTGPG